MLAGPWVPPAPSSCWSSPSSVPSGQTKANDQGEFKGPGGAPNAHVRIERASKLGKDPLKGWKKLEPRLKHQYGGYRKLGIKKVSYREAAADWDFIWPTQTGKSRIRYRGFIAEDGKAYAIYWHTLNSNWKDDYHFFEGFCATFKPKK